MNEFEKVVTALKEKAENVEPFDKKIQLILDGRSVVINGYSNPLSIETGQDNADEKFDVTATSTLENFSKVLNKQINAQMAMMSGKIKIEGNMLAAVPLMKLL